jgi:hypothetical protein
MAISICSALIPVTVGLFIAVPDWLSASCMSYLVEETGRNCRNRAASSARSIR